MKSISKRGSSLDKSTISPPKEPLHITHMTYDADSGLISGIPDPHWVPLLKGLRRKEVVADEMDFTKDLIQNYSERQQVPATPPPPGTMARSGAPTSLPSHPAARTQPPPGVPHRHISPVVEYGQPPPLPRPRGPTLPTHGPPAPPVRPLPPQSGGLPLPLEAEPRQAPRGIPYSRERYRSVFCSARSPFALFSASKFTGNTILHMT